MQCRLAIGTLVLLLTTGCGMIQSSDGTRRHYADPLARRADSLIALLLEQEGSISVGGDMAYAFITDQALLDQISKLEGHAFPVLLDCLGDAKPSRVTDGVSGTLMLRGAVCGEVAIHSDFGQEQIVENGLGVAHDADKAVLLDAQKKWKALFSAHLERGGSLLPKDMPPKAACYAVQLLKDPKAPSAIDTTQLLVFELDTLPEPGTVRPTSVRLGQRVAVNGRASWGVVVRAGVVVRWSHPGGDPFLQLTFGRRDIKNDERWTYQSVRDSIALIGSLVPQRVPCPVR